MTVRWLPGSGVLGGLQRGLNSVKICFVAGNFPSRKILSLWILDPEDLNLRPATGPRYGVPRVGGDEQPKKYSRLSVRRALCRLSEMQRRCRLAKMHVDFAWLVRAPLSAFQMED